MDIHDDHDDDSNGEHPMAKYHELFTEKAEGLEEAGRKVGLYVRDVSIAMAPSHPGADPAPVMVANFTIGDVAWSDRIQNYDQYTTEGEFRKLAVQMDKEKFEEMRIEMERKLKEGNPLDVFEAEDEDDGA